MSGSPADAYIALGSNLGDRLALLRSAVALLAHDHAVECRERSPIYVTSPVGGPADQADYLNAVVHVRTHLGARELLDRCLRVESALGRIRTTPDAARVIDLDLLLYAQQVIAEPGLRIPHPRMHQRRFVLVPLADLAPALVHPELGKTIAKLLADLPASAGRVERAGLAW